MPSSLKARYKNSFGGVWYSVQIPACIIYKTWRKPLQLVVKPDQSPVTRHKLNKHYIFTYTEMYIFIERILV